ncbi:HpcH/HpaI aldolase/citrate lyase family protein [Cupriavidus sp. PET2-C1]
MPAALTRTYLAVPAHQARLVESAARSAADAVFLDLEDAVPEAQKAAALDSALQALNQLDWGTKTVSVRVNSERQRQDDELRALSQGARRLDTVLIPKVESPQALHAAADTLARGPTRMRALGLEAMIETAAGLVHCESIAGASPLLASLHFGAGDFSASIGAKSVEIGQSPPGYAMTSPSSDDSGSGGYRQTPLDMWAYPMMRILVAARAFGLRAIDAPCGAFRDAVLSRDSALRAAAMGYDGKQVIHPSQIDDTNTAFLPTQAEIAQAARVVEALAQAQRAGRGAVQLDGKLVDYANIRMAQRIMAMQAGPGDAA